MPTSDEAKRAYRDKLRSLTFSPTGPKFKDTANSKWVKPGEFTDVRDKPDVPGNEVERYLNGNL